MKTKPDKSWFHWSDGRSFTREEWRKMAFVLKRVEKVKGESFKQRFLRVRATVEKYEATKARTIVEQPGVVRRAWDWLLGRPAMVKVEMK